MLQCMARFFVCVAVSITQWPLQRLFKCAGIYASVWVAESQPGMWFTGVIEA
jgi:hypothetical protein